MGLFDKLTGRVGEFFDEVMIPDELRITLESADRALRDGDVEGALALLDRVDRLRPDLARVHYLRGLCHLERGAPQEAARSMRRVLEIREDALAHLHAGFAFEQLRMWRDAQQHLKRALAMDARAPFAFEALFGLGRVAMGQGRADRAIKELRRALKLEPEHASALLALSEALLARGQVNEAREAIDRMMQREDSARVALLDGKIARAQGVEGLALAALSRALGMEGLSREERLEAALGAATLALGLGATARANTLLVQALDVARGDERADVLVLMGEAHERVGNDPQALASFEDAIRQRGGHGGALRGAGRMALKLGHPGPAAEYFTRALDAEVARDPHKSLLGLGKSCLALGEYARARKLLDEAARSTARGDALSALTSPPAHDPELLHALGRVALATQDPAEALMRLQEARAQATNAPQLIQAIDADTAQALEALRPRWQIDEGADARDDALALGKLMRGLRDHIAADARLLDLLPAAQELLRNLDSPLSIAIVGEFNAGKSTLINTLIGEDIVPMGVLPTTAHTGILQYGPRQAARIVYRDGREVEVSFAEAKRQMKTNAEDIDHLDYLYPHPELRAVHFWDTPGFNALDERHEAVATRALEEAEAILWVLDANQALSETEFSLIERLPGGSARLLIVLNKIDRLGDGEEREALVEEIMEHVMAHAEGHIAGCYPVSALQARRAMQAAPDAPLPAPEDDPSGFASFRQHLNDQIIARAGHIKAIEGRRHLARLVFTLGAFQRGLLGRYGELITRVEALHALVSERRERRPDEIARAERMTIEERTHGMITALVQEIDEALRPRSGFGALLGASQQVLTEEDRDFLLTMLRERLDELLRRSHERVMQEITSQEAELVGLLEPALHGLALHDARGVQRRLDGFYDEVRALRLVLDERVYGRFSARATGQIEAAGLAALAEIEAARGDEARWRGALRRLIPDARAHIEAELSRWYGAFFDAAARLFDRIQRDLALLELEARHRYDLTALEALLASDLERLTAPDPADALDD